MSLVYSNILAATKYKMEDRGDGSKLKAPAYAEASAGKPACAKATAGKPACAKATAGKQGSREDKPLGY